MDSEIRESMGSKERSRRSYDVREPADLELDAYSDLDATEFLQTDPLTADKGSSTLAYKTDPQPRWLRQPSCNCCLGRSRGCILTCLGILALIWIALGAGGFFAYKKYKQAPPTGQSPPWYPTPKGGISGKWADSYRKASEMVAKMTLPEKVNVTTGTGWQMGPAVGNTGPAINVGFPALYLQDGPLGIRFADNATAFPAGITVGATWNKELMYQWGNVHAIEARKKGINVILGPCIGPLGRTPLGGRNWEGFGADPYLQGIAASQSIRGIQDEGVMATIKHFVANEQEHFRQSWEWGLPNAISSNIDDRTLHELYMWPFGDAVKASVASVMCSYNQVNNSYACGNSKLLNGILKDELGFQGFVMSDWLAQRGGVSTALAGLDMTMPGDGLSWADGKSLWGSEMTQSILNGSVPLERLNDMATRIVAAWYQLGQDDQTRFDPDGPNFSSWTDEEYGIDYPGSPSPQEKHVVNEFVNVMGNHSLLARQIAAEGTVLLKNEDFLPLDHEGITYTKSGSSHKGVVHIGIFGEDAGPGDGPNACKDRGCNQGTLASGWGSGAVEFPYLITPVEALTKAFDDGKTKVTSYLKNTFPSAQDSQILEDQDICIVFANADSGEGFVGWDRVAGDRPDLDLQKGGDDLIVSVAKGCGGGKGDTIVVVHSVGPVLMEKWIDLPRVKAVLLANLPGQESGNALVDVIFGHVNPSGHLPWTIAKSLADYGPSAPILTTPNGVVPQQDFSEGVFIDYRHFDKHAIAPRFEFGFGLSYSKFIFARVPVVTELKPKTALPVRRPRDFAMPPEYDTSIPDEEEALFPPGFRKLDKYIYPYLDSIDEIVTDPYPYPDGYTVQQPLSEAGGEEGGNPDLWEVHVSVSLNVTNDGPFPGAIVLQLYMGYPPEANSTELEFPVKVLRGFEKKFLGVNETQTITFNLTRRDLSYWDVTAQNWRMVMEGQYSFMLGTSSLNLMRLGSW